MEQFLAELETLHWASKCLVGIAISGWIFFPWLVVMAIGGITSNRHITDALKELNSTLNKIDTKLSSIDAELTKLRNK